MDGSEVSVAVYGGKEVGKTTFISQSLELFKSMVNYETAASVHICGREVSVNVIRNPEKMMSADAAIVLIDLTNKDALAELPAALEKVKVLSPNAALTAVVATKADLYRLRKTATEDAVRFCETWAEGSLPYYETGLDPPDSIMFAFQEILAKPLIDQHVTKVTREPERTMFINEAMDWCLENGSANLLSHLCSLGNPIPPPLFIRHTHVLSEYLFSQRPPIQIPEFIKNDLSIAPEPTNFEDTLDEPEEPLQIIDTRPAISLTPSHSLPWSRLSLSVFLAEFLRSPSLSGFVLTHIDLSRNFLSEIPLEIFLLPHLKSLNVSHNSLSCLPPVDNWARGSKLQILSVSHNSLTGGGSPLPGRRGELSVSVPCAMEVWNVDLSHNKLGGFPNWVMRFPSLRILNLCGNPQLRTLPTRLSQMTHLYTLTVDPAFLHDPPPTVAKRGPADLLRYLHLKRQTSQVWSCLRVVVVGPQGSGKSQLLARIREDKNVPANPTKGLEVTEWRHKGADFFAFKSKQTTVDFWDFSGDPSYSVIYSCFHCSSSLHLLVCDSQKFLRSTLLHWLAGIQATSSERIPVILIFTHIDKFPSREAREGFRKKVIHLLQSWQVATARKGRSHSSLSAFPQNIRNIFGEELASSFDSPSHKSSSVASSSLATDEGGGGGDLLEDLPLLPNIHRVFFVNAVVGDGVGAIKKCLVKIASGSLAPELASFSGFQMIGREIPQVYAQVEMVVRQLRARFRSVRREGEQRPFYSLSELYNKKLRRPLGDNGITERDFAAALNFLNSYGLVYIYKCKEPPATLVSIDPQLVGYLLQRMIRAGLVTKEMNPTSCYLPNSHIFMLWGVEPVWSRELEPGPDTIHSQHILHFLHHLNLCSPLLPGLTLLPSILPDQLAISNHPTPSPSLRSHRVYFFGFLPLHLFPQLISRVIRSFLIITGGIPSPISPGHAPSANLSLPFEFDSGHVLYTWKNNLFLTNKDGGQILLKLTEGGAASPGTEPYEARIDIYLHASPRVEAKWLRTITTEIDYLLENVYPGLLNSEFSGQLVEVFVPFLFDGGGGGGGGDSELMREMRRIGEAGEEEEAVDGEEEEEDRREDVEEEERRKEEEEDDDVFASGASPICTKSPRSPASIKKGGREGEGEEEEVMSIGRRRRGSERGGRRSRGGVVPVFGSVPSTTSLSSNRQRLLVDQINCTSSWEVISKHSSTSTRFSFRMDSAANHYLVPVWECLRAAFTSPIVHFNNRKIRLDCLVPDLLFGDLSPEHILRIDDNLNLSSPTYSSSAHTSPTHLISPTSTASPSSIASPPDKLSPVSSQSPCQFRMRASITVQNGTETVVQNGMGIIQQNGMETEEESMRTKRSHSSDGRMVVHGTGTFGNGMECSSSGLHIRSYFTSEEEENFMKKESNTARMLSLKLCLEKARRDLDKLRKLQCPYIVSAVGIHFSPPSVAVESAPLGSLHRYLTEERLGLLDIGTTTIHHILLQLLSALEYFHGEGLNYHTLQSENVLIWSRNPISIKLADSGITHLSTGCELCAYIRSIASKMKRKMVATRIDYMLLGLLIYEIATGSKPFEGVHPLSTVVLCLIHRTLRLNVEAELTNAAQRRRRRRSRRRKKSRKEDEKEEDEEEKLQTPVSCHRLCMQSSIELCVERKEISPSVLRARLSLCAGDQEWSPIRLTLNPECLLCSEDGDLVYWTSASRGLVTGTLDIHTGYLNSNILQEAPRPESGMFAKRHPKPVPIAVGRATALTLVEETQQLWVGAENGSRGSVYVFKLPDMRTHHYIHLQDAVLSLSALNQSSVKFGGADTKYRVLVGMANGALIQFLGVHQGKILENPLQGPKLVAYLVGNRPCIALQLTPQGHVWCSSGSNVEVFDTVTLQSIRQLKLGRGTTEPQQGRGTPRSRGDVITLMRVNRYGVWTVGRRSPILKLWNQESGVLLSHYNIQGVLNGGDDDITAMSLQGQAVWLGTRNGYLLLLDAAAVEETRESCHLGLQHCGAGKIKNIIPLVNSRQLSPKLEVFCSLEFPDEVSGCLMLWRYQCQQDWRPKPSSTRSQSVPLPNSSSK